MCQTGGAIAAARIKTFFRNFVARKLGFFVAPPPRGRGIAEASIRLLRSSACPAAAALARPLWGGWGTEGFRKDAWGEMRLVF